MNNEGKATLRIQKSNKMHENPINKTPYVRWLDLSDVTKWFLFRFVRYVIDCYSLHVKVV